jgi:hypothetical protein
MKCQGKTTRLGNKLLFTRGRKRSNVVLVSTSVNIRKPIPEEDLKPIPDSLKPYTQ